MTMRAAHQLGQALREEGLGGEDVAKVRVQAPPGPRNPEYQPDYIVNTEVFLKDSNRGVLLMLALGGSVRHYLFVGVTPIRVTQGAGSLVGIEPLLDRLIEKRFYLGQADMSVLRLGGKLTDHKIAQIIGWLNEEVGW
jgi:hypothetical protein